MQTQKVIDHIVNWLADYADTAKLNGFVVGVSGGIDSAVTSTLCAKTLKNVIVLNMPIHQSSDQVTLSEKHINCLERNYKNVKGEKIDLTPVFQSFENVLPSGIQDGLTMANTRSRIRMITLYSFAAHHRYLVAGTGNKVEDFGVGFYTKYGDGGVDISPIADLTKTEVYTIAKELNIIKDIQEAAPTDGLWHDNRTDESQIGASYAELEWAMAYVEKSDKDLKLNERQKEVLNIYKNFNSANKHKMMPIPICHIPNTYKQEKLKYFI